MILHTNHIQQSANELGKKLMHVLSSRAKRELFFSTFSRLLHEHFHFDRLCINLYDQQGEMLTYFTAAEGTVVSTLSPVRPAEASSTVAGHVIATRKPVIITDFAQYFSESSVHPIAEAGLKATMAFPLVLDNEIIATLHCSFAEKPDNIYEITSFLVELSPVIAVCLGAILSLEHLSYNRLRMQDQFFSIPSNEERVICHSKAMREIMRKVDAAARLHIPILLLGETGTGKTLLAQDIHRRSERKERHFVRVNCPALPQTLFESELFGHAKGAFTGAASKRVGRFELAHNGTLFLDEIAELAPEMQSKLLQVLEESSFERVGESVPLSVDVRIIAATNAHIGDALAKGKLRPDLFYRLSPCTIELPPLRERAEDIPPLVTALSAQVAANHGLAPIKFSPALMHPMLRYDWPGNVRELRNIVSRLVIGHGIHKQIVPTDVEAMLEESRSLLRRPQNLLPISPGAEALPESPLRPHLPATSAQAKDQPDTGNAAQDTDNGTPETLAEMERRHIRKVLARTGGTISGPSGAAALLGIPRSTLQHRMQKLGIS
ncbi:MAG: sigma-54-dependent Fis family transcriptional regulator [Desulfovibrionaceae bacterium]|nr:sigma-54-dependent Fis family transcriptional regulator [Desulfovibrionaceae bacterium]